MRFGDFAHFARTTAPPRPTNQEDWTMTRQVKKRLSPRAVELLTLIRDHTDKDWTTGTLRSYWLPTTNRTGDWSETLGRFLHVSGPGDATCLRALARKGLIRHPPGAPADFAYEITEEGLLALAEHQSA